MHGWETRSRGPFGLSPLSHDCAIRIQSPQSRILGNRHALAAPRLEFLAAPCAPAGGAAQIRRRAPAGSLRYWMAAGPSRRVLLDAVTETMPAVPSRPPPRG